MRAVDTNIVVRFLTDDDPKQATKARAIIGHGAVFVSRTVLLEVEWVLRGVYKVPTDQIIQSLRALAGLPGVSIEDAVFVAQAMDWAEAGMDFADALHLAAAGACECLLTFDKGFVRHGARIDGVVVMVP
jgi:predicted nucleic-acid-binding protein